MHYRSESLGVANHFHRTRRIRPAIVCAPALAVAAALALFIGRANAQSALPPAMESESDASAPPMSESGGGDMGFFSQDLGTIFRLRYNTPSYGQDGNGNFDIGTMKMVTYGDTAAFFDGQVTMNDSDGVGFNVGVGYRWMNYPPYAANSGRMDGVSLWADGTHTEAGNFFPQVGVSYESLGERWDVRANGYVPVGEKEQVGHFNATNAIGFQGNSLSNITIATADRSFYSAELEIARRLGAEREAWGFAGPYFVANDDQDSAGFRAGLRGYAYPDLLLQFAVSDDDVFKTNATFSIVWFVGRTRTNFQPACGSADRMREPVMRNDYVVLSHKDRIGGVPLTQAGGSAISVVHVDSSAPDGGDGTFEHPLNNLDDIQANSKVAPIVKGSNISPGSDIILVHGGSTFSGQTAVLQDRQQMLGEGNNLPLPVTTIERGSINLPESSPGASARPKPLIANAPAPGAIVLASTNSVVNFTIDGGAAGIVAGANGSGFARIFNTDIKNTTGDGIRLSPTLRVDTADINGNNNTTEEAIDGSYEIQTVTLDNIGGDGIKIDATLPNGITLPDPNVGNSFVEAITLTNIKSTNGNGVGINIANTHAGTGNTTTLTAYTYDGGTTSAGAYG